ncbi:MAG: hypothetical protein BZ136_08505 [Methanosphaera sp. rholeuAM74]|nr:MAG: hypothetical protein BZ136_08505 [Methanosphaera sp. rholeuAM74]
MQEIKPWEKQPYERDHNLFQDYLLFDGTLEQFAQENGISQSRVSKVSAKHNWKTRKQAYKEHISQKQLQKRETQLEQHMDKEYQIIELFDEMHLLLMQSLKNRFTKGKIKESTASFTMKNISDSRRLNNQLAYLLAGKSDTIPPEQTRKVSINHEISPSNSPEELRKRIDEKLEQGSQKIQRKEVYEE